MTIDFGFRDLEIFAKVVELESFSKAAEAVFLAQATVSERIASLESKVGTQLLDRLGRKVVPTAAGELMYKHAILLSETKENAIQELNRFLGLDEGEIALGGSTIPGEYILPGLIGQFHQLYPNLTVNLTIADSRKVEKAVEAGRLEIAVIGKKANDPHLISQKLWQDELVLALSTDHALAKRRSVSIESIQEYPFVFRKKGSGTLKIFESYLLQSGNARLEDFIVRARFDSSTAIKEAVKSGLGLSILSRKALEADVRTGLIKIATIKGLRMKRHFFIVRHKMRVISPAADAMLKFLRTTTDV